MAIKRMGKTLSAREQKKQVMEWTGWTSEEYQRQYDILRNRVRAYQKITGSERKRNVADILAREARRRFYSAGRSTPLARSGEAEIIFSTPSISSGKRGRVAAPTSERINIENFADIDARFHGFITKSKFAADIAAEVEELKKNDNYTSGRFRDIVMKHIDIADEERALIVEDNKASRDMASRKFWHSK